MAWVGDDILLVYRSVLNLHHGHGPNFNIDERAYSYTHVLWLWLLSALYLIHQNLYLDSILTQTPNQGPTLV